MTIAAVCAFIADHSHYSVCGGNNLAGLLPQIWLMLEPVHLQVLWSWTHPFRNWSEIICVVQKDIRGPSFLSASVKSHFIAMQIFCSWDWKYGLDTCSDNNTKAILCCTGTALVRNNYNVTITLSDPSALLDQDFSNAKTSSSCTLINSVLLI